MSDKILTHDGTPLKASLDRSLRKQKARAFLLTAPLLLFVLVSFIFPVFDMLFRSVDNSIVGETLPLTVKEIAKWNNHDVAPDEAVFEALYRDLTVAVAAKKHTRLGSRINYEYSGASSLFRSIGRKLKNFEADVGYKEQFIQANKKWGNVELWQTIYDYRTAYTEGYFLNAADMQLADGRYQQRDEEQRIYLKLFKRTFIMSLIITVSCIILGYPVAYLLSHLPMRQANLLMILVLLPFWTSLLVRTSAWKILLQQQGVINDTLVWIGLVSDDARLILINNLTGTIIAMTHILLPFMILPLYSVMKTISPSYVRAAKSLGATNWTAFWRIYFPNSIPGIGAGSILVFILAIGYYITPALVGGTSGIFISNRIAYHISSSLNWGLAAALGTMLLAVVLFLYWLYDKIVGIDNVKLG